MSDFRDKTVLITGAASGLGHLMATRIAAEGARVVLWDVNRQGLEAVRAQIAGSGGRASVYACDLTDRRAIATTGEQTLRELGPVDILVNNAGIVSGKTLLAASDDDIQRTFDVNTLALFWVTRAFLPAMLERNSGHIVTIASAAGIVGTARLVDYCASKHAAVGFDESLRLELKRQRSKVMTTVICPFYISTGMFEGVKTRVPWLLPILEPEYAVDRILHAVRHNRRRLVMPRLVAMTYLGRLLPVPVFDALMEFLGVTRSMDEFKGRVAEPSGPEQAARERAVR